MASSDTSEPTLDAVKEEDRAMVRDVLRVIQRIGAGACSSYAVNVVPKGYEVVGWIRGDRDVEVPYDELGLVELVNELRVKVLGVSLKQGNMKACLRVRVISHDERCMLVDTVLDRVKKRARWAA